MITVQQADRIIAQHMKSFPVVQRPLSRCRGTVLQEDIFADRDCPPFNKSLLDGIAIQYASLKDGNRVFAIRGIQAAGQSALAFKKGKTCVEIMTGAVVPAGADCVIGVEQITKRNGKAHIDQHVLIQKSQNIRPQGADHRQGSRLLKKGCRMLPVQIAIAASVGKTPLKVSCWPHVAIVTTGDELVDFDKAVKPYQIRKSNSYFIETALSNTGLFSSRLFHFKDDKKILLKGLKNILHRFDVVVLTGGVSMGRYDYIPQVLQQLKVRVHFHKVKQRPGKPFWFGTSTQHKPVFALPGNPVSTQICLFRYVIPHLQLALGLQLKKEYAQLKKYVKIDSTKTHFLPVQIRSHPKGQIFATPVTMGGSGDFASLGKSDGFIEIPLGKRSVRTGYAGRIYRWQ